MLAGISLYCDRFTRISSFLHKNITQNESREASSFVILQKTWTGKGISEKNTHCWRRNRVDWANAIIIRNVIDGPDKNVLEKGETTFPKKNDLNTFRHTLHPGSLMRRNHRKAFRHLGLGPYITCPYLFHGPGQAHPGPVPHTWYLSLTRTRKYARRTHMARVYRLCWSYERRCVARPGLLSSVASKRF